MFSEASVCPQGGACVAKGGAYVMVGCMHGGWVWQRACMAGEMVTAADVTHPNGMHSCSVDVGMCNLGQCQGHL